jgi:hypothetical protein
MSIKDENPARADCLELLALRQQLPIEIGEQFDELIRLIADAPTPVRERVFYMLSDIIKTPISSRVLHVPRIKQVISYLRSQQKNDKLVHAIRRK